jgi:Novel STAND NTPase 1
VWVDDDALPGVVGMVVAAAQRDGDRVGYAIPAAVLRTAWPAILGPRIRAACPYCGLRAFREQDAELFCGRDEEIARLVEAVRRQPLVVVLGSSGGGRSSLVFAGCCPRCCATTVVY